MLTLLSPSSKVGRLGAWAAEREVPDDAKARLHHKVCEAHLARIVKVDFKCELFSYAVDERALAQAELMDRKLMLLSNVADLTPTQMVQHYKALADIERGFKGERLAVPPCLTAIGA